MKKTKVIYEVPTPKGYFDNLSRYDEAWTYGVISIGPTQKHEAS